MEEMIPALIFIVIGVISSIAKAQKNQHKKDAMEYYKAAEANRVQEAQAKATAAAKPLMSPVHPLVSSAASTGVAQPQVHTHLAPDCETHDKTGSLNFVSSEGKDPCHEDQLTHPRTDPELAAATSGISFDWSGETLVKAFIMQEVLTRPAQRRAR